MYFIGMIVLFLFVVWFAASEWNKHRDVPTGNLHFFDDCPYDGCNDCIDPFE